MTNSGGVRRQFDRHAQQHARHQRAERRTRPGISGVPAPAATRRPAAAKGQQDPAPDRPVLGLAEHERKHEDEHGRRQQGQAGQVYGPARLALAVRQRPRPDDQ